MTLSAETKPTAFDWALTRIVQLCCRHNFMRRWGSDRLWLQCTECGYQTPGIETRRLPKATNALAVPSVLGFARNERYSWASAARR